MHNATHSTKRNGMRLLPVLLLVALLAVVGSDAVWAAGPKNPQAARAARAGAKPKHVNRITPQIPKADRYQRNKVFLENADELIADESRSTEYQVLRGNVRFRRGDMYMFCDSAYYYDKTSSLDAFGHVHMTQADTLQVFADVMHYYGEDQVAQLRHNVRLENRSTTLLTDSLDYEITSNVGYYFNHGTIVDNKNNTELTSEYGRYELDTKQAEFTTNVHLISDQYEMNTNLLRYNTQTHIANIIDETVIVNDSNTIYTSNGWYNTSRDDATLYDRAQINARDGKTLVGDTVYYDRTRNYGEAYGNVILTDEVNHVILDGDYGYHDEASHYSYVTRRARAREFSQGDTLYMHADTLCTIMNDDSIRILKAFRGVRFYRSDVQGVCDSLQLSEADSILNLYRNAVVWNGQRQISGEEINIHMRDSTADWATLPNFGLMIEHLGEDYYDQLSGKKMKAYFENKELRQLDVDGNVMAIMYPQESDSTYNKQVYAESSYMKLNLKAKQEVERLAMWPEVTGKVTPLYLLRKSNYYLPQFKWYDSLRPRRPEDIYRIIRIEN
jgi:lipopolysaccharide export system protein LptA